MEFVDLLQQIRALNVAALRDAIAAHGPAHVEPALRDEEGELAGDGELDLPLRLDFLVRGDESREFDPVTPATQLDFEPFAALLDDFELTVEPFGWDYATVEVDATPEAIGAALQQWFLAHFDTEDENPEDEDGLYGVVHFLSDPEAIDAGATFDVDFGSAPVDAFLDLWQALTAAGATRASIGR